MSSSADRIFRGRTVCVLAAFGLTLLSQPMYAEADATPAQKGVLKVNTAPPGATVSLGGDSPEFQQTLGKTPLTVALDPGTVSLLLEMDGYESAVAETVVSPGKTALMQVRLDEKTWKTNKGLRLAGHLLFWPGLLTAGTGIILIAKDDPKADVNTGMPGFITAGIGTAMTVVGGIILGLTQSKHRDVYTMPEISLRTAPDGRTTGIFGIRKQF